jgi:hypothetical protein
MPAIRLAPKVKTRRIRPQQKIKFKMGFGKADVAADIAKRKKQFQRQQRENLARARSLVGRDPATGRQAVSRVTFKRGARVSAGRLKQFAEFGELEVIREMRVTSHWVSQIHLVVFRNQPALAITFRSGFTALYPTTNIRDYERMSASASKGGYIWATLYHGRPGAGAPYISIGF